MTWFNRLVCWLTRRPADPPAPAVPDLEIEALKRVTAEHEEAAARLRAYLRLLKHDAS